ncbi:MAG: NAD(P)/FAD-dependent oxidoreductase [Bacteroidetes bacterium]|nr:NAD(P)/FAD-dependent oxidoreductase [Bacteroidota bacterium]
MSDSISKILETGLKRIVIAGCGFAGLKVAMKLSRHDFQIIVLDKNNYHQFQPLLYQVATSGLEPSSISFPLRKIFHKWSHIHFRIADVKTIDPGKNVLYTSIGSLKYDYLVLASGTGTNFYGMKDIEKNAIAMKSTSEALYIRNVILQNYECAMCMDDPEEVKARMNIVIVGGGPTGVELAGALAEMKKFVLPKDYPELDFSFMHIYLMESSQRLLNVMREKSSAIALRYLKKLGVDVVLNAMVGSYDGYEVTLKNGNTYRSRTLLWAAGVKANPVQGLAADCYGPSGRMIVDEFNKVPGYSNIFVIGDLALMRTAEYPNGHPQVAQVAIQQARLLVSNLVNASKGKEFHRFRYKDKGTLATVGRNLAVADFPHFSLYGFPAWFTWTFIHLMSIVGIKNRLFIFIDWLWNYITYDQSLRLIIKQGKSE